MNEMPAPDLLAQIDDIKGLDAIGWWPLAPLWWVLLAIIVLTFLALAIIYLRRRAYERSWKGDALRMLATLEDRLNNGSEHEVVSALSLAMRRIAMQRFSRRECASLKGHEWLAWLQEHDPKSFAWTKHGDLLIKAPYAPPSTTAPSAKIYTLIEAAKQWVA